MNYEQKISNAYLPPGADHAQPRHHQTLLISGSSCFDFGRRVQRGNAVENLCVAPGIAAGFTARLQPRHRQLWARRASEQAADAERIVEAVDRRRRLWLPGKRRNAQTVTFSG